MHSSFSWNSAPPSPSTNTMEMEQVLPSMQLPTNQVSVHASSDHTPFSWDNTSQTPTLGDMDVEERSPTPPTRVSEAQRSIDTRSSFSQDAVLPSPNANMIGIDHTLPIAQLLAILASGHLSPMLDTENMQSSEPSTPSETPIPEVRMNTDTSLVPVTSAITMEIDTTLPFPHARPNFDLTYFPRRSLYPNSSPDSVRMDEDHPSSHTQTAESKVPTPFPQYTSFSWGSAVPDLSAGIIGQVTDPRTPTLLGLEWGRLENSSFSWKGATTSGSGDTLPPPGPPIPSRTPIRSSSFSWGSVPPPPTVNNTVQDEAPLSPQSQVDQASPHTCLKQSSFSWDNSSLTPTPDGVEEESQSAPQSRWRETRRLIHMHSSFSWDLAPPAPCTDAMKMEPASLSMPIAGPASMHTNPNHASFSYENPPVVPGPGKTQIGESLCSSRSRGRAQAHPRSSFSWNATPLVHDSDAMETDPVLPPTYPMMNRDIIGGRSYNDHLEIGRVRSNPL